MPAVLGSSVGDGLGAVSVEARGEGTRARVGDRRIAFTIDVPVELRSRGDRAPAPPRGSPAGHDRNDTPRTPQEDHPPIRTAWRARPSVPVAPMGRRGRVRLGARRGPGGRAGRRGEDGRHARGPRPLRWQGPRRLERDRLLRRGDVPRRHVVLHAGQRRLGQPCDRTVPPRRRRCFEERDQPGLPGRGQDQVLVPRTGHLGEDLLADRRQGGRGRRRSARPVGTRIETRGNQPQGLATWETSGALGNITIQKLTPAEVAATNASVK